MIFKFVKASMATVALLVVSIAANAADMPIKAPYYKEPLRSVTSYYNWTGFYVGANAGYSFLGDSVWDLPPVNTKPKGFSAGGTAGYNWQSGSFVYGLEGDLNWSQVKGSVTCPPGDCETKQEWYGTIRGRVGYAFDRFLPYVTAGGVFGHLKATNSGVTPGFEGASAAPFGWTAGAGLEYAFLGNWSAKVEYLYMDFGKFNCIACAAVLTDDVTFKDHTVRIGVNYRFGGAPIFSRY
jgi:outer membrane immunogenic protein